eukprot:5091999-Pleurochrysis_carterae.AAC.1
MVTHTCAIELPTSRSAAKEDVLGQLVAMLKPFHGGSKNMTKLINHSGEGIHKSMQVRAALGGTQQCHKGHCNCAP